MNKIEFNCSRCGTHFTVDAKMAGRKGKCRQCQHRMKIPQRKADTSNVAVSGRFQLGTVSAPDNAGAMSRGYVVNTQAGLAAVAFPSVHRPVSSQPEFESGPYQLNRQQVRSIDRQQKKRRRKAKKPPGRGKQFYWKQTRGLLSVLDRLNDFAYLISLPFLLLVMMGILLPSRSLAVIGAAGVILPNIGRFAVNAFYLAVVPFRESPVQGILFFIPPFTFYYLYKRWPRMKRATIQFLSPAIPIACVVLAFTFVPWLRSGTVPEGASLQDRLRSETTVLRSDIEEQIGDARQKVENFTEDPNVREFTGNVKEGVQDAAAGVKKRLEAIQKDLQQESESTEE